MLQFSNLYIIRILQHYENGDFTKRNYEVMFKVKEQVMANIGVKFGFAAHHPEVIDISEKQEVIYD